MLQALTQFDFYLRLQEQGGVALVVFTAPSCGSCLYLKQLLQEFRPSLENFEVYEVNAAEEGALVNEYEVFHLPSMFLFVDGDYHSPLSSEAHPAKLERAIRAALTQAPLEAP